MHYERVNFCVDTCNVPLHLSTLAPIVQQFNLHHPYVHGMYGVKRKSAGFASEDNPGLAALTGHHLTDTVQTDTEHPLAPDMHNGFVIMQVSSLR
jgi:hypothetical protein